MGADAADRGDMFKGAGGNARRGMTRKGALGPDEIAEAKRLRARPMSWTAVARCLGRAEPDVRRACEGINR